jgi:hypothetical protein
MKKAIILLAVLSLVSCWKTEKVENQETTNTWNQVVTSTWEITTSTWEKIDLSDTWAKVEDIVVNTWEDQEKDSVIITDNNSSTDTSDDLEWKTEEEVVDEMWDYVNDLFNMIEEDVK